MPRLLNDADYRDMPWKNGGGTTRELWRLPHTVRPDDFAMRLSIATVAQGGPFSAFAGVDRTLLLLQGAGMVLTFAAGPVIQLDTPLQALRFAGETAIDCQLLDGPLRDFNLMVARDWGRASLAIEHLRDGETLALPPHGLVLVYLLAGRLALDGQIMQADQLLWLDDETVTVRADGEASLIVVEAHATV